MAVTAANMIKLSCGLCHRTAWWKIYQIIWRYISENRILHIVLVFTKRSHDAWKLNIQNLLWHFKQGRKILNFDVLLTVHLSLFISVINQLDAQNLFYNKFLFHASTCFEHMCSSSGGQNCITQPLVSSHRTTTYRCDDTRGCVMQFWPPDDEHMCSKHVGVMIPEAV